MMGIMTEKQIQKELERQLKEAEQKKLLEQQKQLNKERARLILLSIQNELTNKFAVD